MKVIRVLKSSYPIDIMFLMTFCYIVPFVDSVNGFMVLAEGVQVRTGNIGQLFKACILIFGWCFCENKKLRVVFIGAYMTIIEFIGFLFHNSTGYFFIGFSFAYKIVFALVIYFFTVELFAKYGRYNILVIFRNSALLYALIFFSSVVLGFSYPTYQGNYFATKGPFASGNGLSIYLGAMSLIGLYLFFLSGKKHDFPLSFLLLMATVFVGTKTALVFVSLYVLLLFYKVSYVYKLLLFAFLVVLGLSFYDLFSLLFGTIAYRFENSNSIFSFLASNRDIYVKNASSSFYIEGLYILRLFFGLGVYLSFRTVSDDIFLYDTLENDIFDIFFSYGFIGLITYVSFYLVHMLRAVKVKNFAALILFSTMFSVSALFGHVLFNAMAIIPFVLSAALTNDSPQRLYT